jgi:hypothetical protein
VIHETLTGQPNDDRSVVILNDQVMCGEVPEQMTKAI